VTMLSPWVASHVVVGFEVVLGAVS
jgi:hypothetical protein